jgi:hypothetical protein
VTTNYIDPIVLPPDIEALALSFLAPLLTPVPVATRLPSPNINADTVSGFLRLENGGGEKPNRFQYDIQCILHGYSPDEQQANLIANQAVALMSAARGQTVNGWYVVGVMGVVAPLRLSDPDVILPRYRAAVTWRVAGQVWNP